MKPSLKLIPLLLLITFSSSYATEEVIFHTQSSNVREINIGNNSSISPVIIHDARNESDILFVQPEVVYNPFNNWDNIVQRKNKDYSLIEERLERGQNVNQSIINGNTLLHLAAMQSNETLLNIGLRYQGNVKAKNRDGETPLHWAAYKKNINILNSIIDKNKVIKNKDFINATNKFGKTPLHFAVMTKNNSKQIKILIDNNANLNLADKNKQTAAHYAANLKNWDNLLILLENGADIKLKDANNISVEEIILENMNPEIIGFKKYLSK